MASIRPPQSRIVIPLLVGTLTFSAGCATPFEEAQLRRTVGEAGITFSSRTDEDTIRLPGTPDLAAYVRHAVAHNPGLESAYHAWRAAVEHVPQARALPDPRLSFGYFLSEVETKVGPQRARIGIAQPLPAPGKRAARARVALKAAHVAHAAYEARIRAVVNRVETAWWEYWYLERAISVTDENVALLRQLESVVRAKYTVGATRNSSLIMTQVELGKLEDRLAELRDLREPISAKLATALGRAADEVLPWPKAAAPSRPAEDLEFEALVERAEEQNPELRRSALAAARATAARELARLSRRVDFGVSLDYIVTDESASAGTDSGKDPISLGFSVGLPLARERRDAADRSAEASERAAELTHQQARNELSLALKLAVFRYRDASRRIALYESTLIPQARQAFEVTRTALEADRASSMDIIDTQRTLLEFSLALVRARADLEISRSELKLLAGPGVFSSEEGGSP